jgi:hypothetical protein
VADVHAAVGGVVRRDEAAPVGAGDLLVALLASQAVAMPNLTLHCVRSSGQAGAILKDGRVEGEVLCSFSAG